LEFNNIPLFNEDEKKSKESEGKDKEVKKVKKEWHKRNFFTNRKHLET
jgi:hypothetical protein